MSYTKYINAARLMDKAIQSMKDNQHNNSIQRQSHTAEHRRFIAMIDGMPAEDVIEVRYGKWVPHEVMIRSIDAKNYDCSKCGEATNRCTPYCPNCGAKMN